MSALFAYNPKKPMTFTICKGKRMYNKKLFDYCKKIQENGGIYVDFADHDDDCIILAEKSNEFEDTDFDLFNISYVNNCIKKNKVLDLEKYRLINKKTRSPCKCKYNCEYFAPKCLLEPCPFNNRSAEEDIKQILMM